MLPGAGQEPLVASLFLVAMPFAPSSKDATSSLERFAGGFHRCKTAAGVVRLASWALWSPRNAMNGAAARRRPGCDRGGGGVEGASVFALTLFLLFFGVLCLGTE